jgi:hypothetical protein
VTLSPAVLKVLRVGIQEDGRCILARSKAGGAVMPEQ